METMHRDRAAAERAYQAALKAFNAAVSGASESAFNAAHESLKAARQVVVQMELRHPTANETKRQARVRTLRNRGLDA